MAEEESTVFDALLKLVVIIALIDTCVTISLGLLEHVCLNVFQQGFDTFNDTVHWYGFFLESVTAHDFERVVLKVASTHDKTHGNALQLVVCELESWTLVVGIIILNRYASGTQGVDYRRKLLGYCGHLFSSLGDGDDDHLDRREHRRQYQSVIV